MTKQIRYYYDPISNMMKEHVIEIKDNKMEKNEIAEETIQEPYKSKESIYNGPYSKTTLFMLPMLGLSLRHPYIKKYLLNAYLEDKGFEHDYTRPLFILLKTKNFLEKDFEILSKLLHDLPEFRIDYDLGKQDDHSLVMFIFETDIKYMENYYHFKSGRYSKFTKDYKERFPKETMDSNKNMVESLMWGVMHKSTYRKDMVAKHFTVKDDKGNIKNIEEYNKFRKGLDNWDEVYDSPKRLEEYYRWDIKKE